jgi:hypothetical protein
MPTVNEGPTTGQVGTSTPSVNATEAATAQVRSDLYELVRVIELSSKAFTRTSAVLVKMSERLDTIEAKLDARATPAIDDEAGPITEKRPLDPSPRLALRSDGAMLIELTSDIDDADVADREVRRYATLNEAERADAVDRADEVLGDVAARAGWQLARTRKGYPKADEAPTEETP